MNESEKPVLPTEMVVDYRHYLILPFLDERDIKRCIDDERIIDRAKKIDASLGEEHRMRLFLNQKEIPISLRDEVVFIFQDRSRSGIEGYVHVLYWREHYWCDACGWVRLKPELYEKCRVIQLKV